MPGMFDDLIPEGKPSGKPSGLFDDLIPQAAPAPSTGGPIEAAADVGRLMLRGAAMGKEATPEDAADRANALADIGRKWRRGAPPVAAPSPAAKPEDFRPEFDAQRKEMAAAEARAGYAAPVAEMLGSLVAGGPVFKAFGAVGEAAQAAPTIGKVLANPWAQAAGAGAVLGASSAQGTDADKRMAAGVGAAAGLGGQALGNMLAAGVGKVAGAFNPKPAIPTKEAIEAAKRAAYQEAENAGVVFTPQFSQRVRAEIEPQLVKMGYDPALQPKIAPVIARLEQAGQENITLPGVEVLRKVAANAYEPGNKTSNTMMAKIISAIDDAAASPAAGEVLMGDAVKGAAALQAARKNAQTGFKLEAVEGQIAKATHQAERTYSGSNLDNAMRQKISAILDNPARRRGFTSDEIAAMEQIVSGTPAQNALRWAGKIVPSSGLGGMLSSGAGFAALGPMGIAAPAAGYVARKGSESIAKGNVEKLAEIIRAGGSRAATEATPNAVQRLAKSERDRLARLLTLGILPSAVAAGTQ